MPAHLANMYTSYGFMYLLNSEGLKQEDFCEFKTSLDYTVNCSQPGLQTETLSKQNKTTVFIVPKTSDSRCRDHFP